MNPINKDDNDTLSITSKKSRRTPTSWFSNLMGRKKDRKPSNSSSQEDPLEDWRSWKKNTSQESLLNLTSTSWSGGAQKSSPLGPNRLDRISSAEHLVGLGQQQPGIVESLTPPPFELTAPENGSPRKDEPAFAANPPPPTNIPLTISTQTQDIWFGLNGFAQAASNRALLRSNSSDSGQTLVMVVLAFGFGTWWWWWWWLRWQPEEVSIWMDAAERVRRINREMNFPNCAESVEWMNHLLTVIWPIINREVLEPAVDLLEIILMTQVPGFVNFVTVEGLDQGSHSVRIESLRHLTEETLKAHPEFVGTDYVYLEAKFSYKAHEKDDKNGSAVCTFHIGKKGLAEVIMPVRVELMQLSGMCRLRIQLWPDPPFVKLCSMQLLHHPLLKLSVKPLGTLNVMQFPLISDYIKHCINTVVNHLVAPNSLVVNVGKYLMGDDVPDDCRAIGVVYLEVHQAVQLAVGDASGTSDPYVVIHFKHQRKELHKTRIILKELNPIWEEAFYILIHPEDIIEQEVIQLHVWDWDQWAKDDSLGLAHIELNKLAQQPGRTNRREALKLALSKDAGGLAQGKLITSSSFYPLGFNRDDEKSGVLVIQSHETTDLEYLSYATASESASSIPTILGLYLDIYVNNKLVHTPNQANKLTAKTEVFVTDFSSTNVWLVVKDTAKRDIFGVVVIKLSDYLESPVNTDHRGRCISKWFRLLPGKGVGRIRTSIFFKPLEIPLSPSNSLGHSIGVLKLNGTIRIELNQSKKANLEKLTCQTFPSVDGYEQEVYFNELLTDNNDLTVACVKNLSLSLAITKRSKTVVMFQLRSFKKEIVATAVLWLRWIKDGLCYKHLVLPLIPSTSSSSSGSSRSIEQYVWPIATSCAPTSYYQEDGGFNVESVGKKKGWLKIAKCEFIPGINDIHARREKEDHGLKEALRIHRFLQEQRSFKE